jgi:hypothetical protein
MPVIFVIEAPDLESRAASDCVANSEIVKQRNQAALPARLLIRIGSRSGTLVSQEKQFDCLLDGHPSVSVEA